MPIVKDAEYHRRYYQKNREKLVKRAAKRRADDPEKSCRLRRESYARNKDKVLEREKRKYTELKRRARRRQAPG